MSDKEKICGGCRDYDINRDCSFGPYYKGKICPCSTCLVKMMCNGVCDVLLAYRYPHTDFQVIGPGIGKEI